LSAASQEAQGAHGCREQQMSDDFEDFSPGGSRMHLHRREKDYAPAQGMPHTAQILAHIERHLGPSPGAFHEVLSDMVHVLVHVVPPTVERPWLQLVTSGMSDLPMNLPPGVDVPHFAELMLTLPPDWPMSQQALQDERVYWPIRLLKMLARLPHQYDTWLAPGHTIPHGNPAEPYADDVAFDGAMIVYPETVPEAFAEMVDDDGRTIAFRAVMPLYPEEMDLKLQKGADALLELFEGKGIRDLVEPDRFNVARLGLGLS